MFGEGSEAVTRAGSTRYTSDVSGGFAVVCVAPPQSDAGGAARVRVRVSLDGGRGIHSSTFRLNVSALSGIGGAFRGCLGV